MTVPLCVRLSLCSILILQDDVECMNDAWNVSQYGKQDVDQEVPATDSLLKEHSQRRKDNRCNELQDVAACECHDASCVVRKVFDCSEAAAHFECL